MSITENNSARGGSGANYELCTQNGGLLHSLGRGTDTKITFRGIPYMISKYYMEEGGGVRKCTEFAEV